MSKILIALVLACASVLAVGSKVLSVERTEASVNETANGTANETIREAQQDGYYEPAQYDDGFDIEVLVGGIPLDEYRARGKTYVEASEGQEYEIRVHNPLGVRVAVALAVDGLNTIDASHTTAYNASKWVVGPYQTITISGWQMSSSRARHFYFTTERNSYGARLGQTENLGVISAVFFRERTPRPIIVTPRTQGSSRPRQEDERGEYESAPEGQTSSSAQSGGARTQSVRPSPDTDDGYAATGIGRSVNNDVRWMNMELVQSPVAEVNVRYEFHDALVRLGVIPRPRPYPDPIRRRERATGFDGHRYSPEP